ncbi:tetratricopeptide repeat protein [Bradyrhizobium sp. UFLA05-153]
MRSAANVFFACLAAGVLGGLSTVAAADDKQTCADESGDIAIAACSRAIESGSWQGRDLAEIYGIRGAEHANKGDLDRAIADYNEAIRLDPSDGNAYENRGVARYKKGWPTAAILDYNEAIRLDPNHASTYYYRAMAWYYRPNSVYYNKEDDLDRAIADFNESIRLDPRHAAAYYYRGIVKQQKGDHPGGDSDIAAARRIDPNIGK